jgi:hypothetical protein
MEVSVKSAQKRNLLPDSNRAVLRPPGTRSRSGSFSFFYNRLSDFIFLSLRPKFCWTTGFLPDRQVGKRATNQLNNLPRVSLLRRRYKSPEPTIRQHSSHTSVAQSLCSILQAVSSFSFPVALLLVAAIHANSTQPELRLVAGISNDNGYY